MPQLEGLVALITGSDSGIGRATAEAFAEAGADVAVTYHSDSEGADETRRAVERCGRRAVVRQLDVRDEASVASLFDEVEAELALPDILVNNAGVGASGASVAETSAEEFDRVIRTDLYGPFFCCREFVRRRGGDGAAGRGAAGPSERGAPNGKIINVTSVHEAIPSPGNASYGAAKGGLLTFTRSLALELAPLCINVNAIAPGLIRTPMTRHRVDDPGTRAEEMPNIPWRRAGRPWEVARLALYLASAESDYVTGQSMTIDGGLEMNWGQGA